MTAPPQPAIITPNPPAWYIRALSFAENAPHWGKVTLFFVVLALAALVGGDLYGRSQYTAGVNAGATSVKEQAIGLMRHALDSATTDLRRQLADANALALASQADAARAHAQADAAQSAYRAIPRETLARTDPAVLSVLNSLQASNDTLLAANARLLASNEKLSAALAADTLARNGWRAIADSTARVVAELHEHPPEAPCRLKCITVNAGKAAGYFAIGFAAAKLR